MFDNVDQRFEEIKKIAIKNDLDFDFIEKAYLTAKRLHKDQKRKDGTPYIFHPVEVALILAQLDFDENVIAGGLLHDTVEDCGYQIEDLRKDFNDTVARLVDCVSAIDNTKYVLDKENIYEDENFLKLSAEEQTFKKLISLGKENPCGFAIKFADRLHNLRTINSFEYAKQLEKVRETEKYILPIAKALHSEYFYRSIKNECFKIVNRTSEKQYLDHYNVYHNANKQNIDELKRKFKELFSGTFVKRFEISDVREYKVFEDLTRLYKKIEVSKVSQGQILKVANYNVFMLYKNATHKEALNQVIQIISNKTNLSIIDIKIGGFTGKMYLQIQDEIKNKYNIYIISDIDYSKVTVGTLDGQNLDLIDEENINDLEVELIKVRTRSSEVTYIQKNSTVLDFAFKIHRDIGFAFKYAIINDGKTKFPPYTRLNENDKVEIFTEKDENGNLLNNAQLKWLAYVNTTLAKKALIKYFDR